MIVQRDQNMELMKIHSYVYLFITRSKMAFVLIYKPQKL
jgi:hypothetical protein